ncbi:MAG: cupin domain-containing protein [Pseudomonadota bacterium]
MQDINPLGLALADYSRRVTDMQWTETVPGKAYAKVVWTGAESGGWAALVRWMKGYAGPPHKHLTAAHTFVLSGCLFVDGHAYGPGTYVYEPTGIIHQRAEALEDTEFFFISNGPILFLGDGELSHYVGWEEARRLEGLGPGSFGWIPPAG